MEINVSAIIDDTRNNPTRFSASIAETGLENIGQITWNNAKEQKSFALTKDQIEPVKNYIREFGAWDDDEIDSWDAEETTALFVQFVSGDYRNLENEFEQLGYDIDDFDDDQFQEVTENFGGSLYKGDNGQWYYYAGM